MKKYILIFCLLTVLEACEDETYKEIDYTRLSLKMEMPEQSLMDWNEMEIRLINQTTQEVIMGRFNEIGEWKSLLESGLYQIRINGQSEKDGKFEFVRYVLDNKEIIGEEATIYGTLDYSKVGGDWVFKEIYTAGSPSYAYDQFVEIYNNNSKDTLFADGLLLCETYSPTQSEYLQTLPDSIIFGAMYAVPGDGKSYPVAPGKSIVIANQAQNHHSDPMLSSSSPVDLANANFEWYDVFIRDIDNPDVPNLVKYVCYSKSIWIMAVSMNRSLFVCRLPEGTNVEDYLLHNQKKVLKQTGKYDLVYAVPTEYVLDGVELNSKVMDKKTLPVLVDAGWTYSTGSYLGCSVQRKVSKVGNIIYLQDTNNSTDDFMVGCIPSPFVIPM